MEGQCGMGWKKGSLLSHHLARMCKWAGHLFDIGKEPKTCDKVLLNIVTVRIGQTTWFCYQNTNSIVKFSIPPLSCSQKPYATSLVAILTAGYTTWSQTSSYQRMHSLFRDGNRNFEFTIVMYHMDNGQRSYKPQAKHAERMILPGSSQNLKLCTLYKIIHGHFCFPLMYSSPISASITFILCTHQCLSIIFVPSSVSIWNHLPHEALTAHSITSFKSSVSPLFL